MSSSSAGRRKSSSSSEQAGMRKRAHLLLFLPWSFLGASLELPSSFQPLEAEKKFLGRGWVVKNDSSVISFVKESRLIMFSYLNEGDLE